MANEKEDKPLGLGVPTAGELADASDDMPIRGLEAGEPLLGETVQRSADIQAWVGEMATQAIQEADAAEAELARRRKAAIAKGKDPEAVEMPDILRKGRESYEGNMVDGKFVVQKTQEQTGVEE